MASKPDGGKPGVVVIGYGAVGGAVCALLADRLPLRVVAAGRNLGKAEAFSRKTGGRVLPLQLDLDDPSGSAEALEGAKVVVACAEPDDAAFAREVLGRGIHYVDVSASDAYLREVGELDALARERGATAVLSVGLSPGLTNLLARHCVDVLDDEIRNIDVSLMLGLGEAHGEAAVRWTVENLNKAFRAPGVSGIVHSLTDPKRSILPGGYGARTAYRFDLADQHVLARTLGAEKVATRLCFDPAAATRLLALLKRMGALRSLNQRRVRETLISLLSRLHAGSDAFAVKVEAEGQDGSRHSCSAWGRGQGHATAVVAALAAERLLTTDLERGVFHIEQLFDPYETFSHVEKYGILVDRGTLGL
jgi:saccharopine dehydrogenase-like NADP-dependent oxidoreductase